MRTVRNPLLIALSAIALSTFSLAPAGAHEGKNDSSGDKAAHCEKCHDKKGKDSKCAKCKDGKCEKCRRKDKKCEHCKDCSKCDEGANPKDAGGSKAEESKPTATDGASKPAAEGEAAHH